MLKRLAKEALPPFLYRLAKKMVPRHAAAGGCVGISSRSPHSVILTDGTVINHRGSDADHGVLDQIFVQRDYDLSTLRRYPEIMALYDELEQPVIVDCGANIGASVAWFSSMYLKAKIIAVEPERENFALLAENCRGPRVVLVQGALAATSGNIILRDPGEGEWGFRASADDKGDQLYEVPAFSIADLMALLQGTPFILKIDIEGAESGLFEDYGDVFDAFAVVIIELHDWMLPRSGSSKSFLRWHNDRDRDFVFRGENVFSISNVRIPRL